MTLNSALHLKPFRNLCFTSSRAFRDHNFCDCIFRFGHSTIEQLPESDIESELARAFAPEEPGRKHEISLPPDFDATLRLTLSPQCWESFARSNPALPISLRDYYLSKLFQFLYLLLEARFGQGPTGETEDELIWILNRIPSGYLPPDARIDWVQFWWETFVDCRTQYSVTEVVARLKTRLRGLIAPTASVMDKRGPRPKTDIRDRIVALARRWSVDGRNWKSELEQFCRELDADRILASDGRSKGTTTWTRKLKDKEGKAKVVKAIERWLKVNR